MKKILLIIVVVSFISVFFYYANTFWKQMDSEDVVKVATSTQIANNPQLGLGNPASANCMKVGGRLVIEKRGDGGEFGLCYFEENRACEEWALLRGECPLGGRKTTGYDTKDQSYCAWLGGETFAVENSKCTFKNKKVCPTIDLYNGTCSPSN